MGETPRAVLGLICHQGHASSAALVEDGRLVAAASEERFTRRKRETGFPRQAIEAVLKSRGLALSDVAELAFAWSPAKTLVGQARQALAGGLPSLSYVFGRRAGHWRLSRFEKLRLMWTAAEQARDAFGPCPPLRYVSHHLAHSYAACLGADRSRPLLSAVVDGAGEDASLSFYGVVDGEHRRLVETPFPHSLGVLYSAVTQVLGFEADGDEYKVMGLSAYGGERPEPRLRAAMDGLAQARGARLTLDLRHFALHRGGDHFYEDSLLELLGLPREGASFEQKAAVARCLQDLLETRLAELIEQAAELMPRRPEGLCGGGGVFLNCLMNQRLRERLSDRFESFHFSPIADDNGSAAGAAALAWRRSAGRWPETPLHLFLGPGYGEERLLSAASSPGCEWRRPPDAASEAARLLAEGRVLGFFQGRSEFGPRALGARSILADPRSAAARERVNRRIKLREPFRPFAPSVLAERAAEWFRLPPAGLPFMIETARPLPGRAALIPAVVHVDGTSRVQTVSREHNAPFHAVLSAFEALTGVPVLLNTSFNLDGQPIVETPEDAVACYLESGLDALVLGPLIVERRGAATKPPGRAASPR